MPGNAAEHTEPLGEATANAGQDPVLARAGKGLVLRHFTSEEAIVPHPPERIQDLAGPALGWYAPPRIMGCLIGCLALVTPRLALFLVFLFSNYLGRAYDSILWPLLGFFLMPLTTLAYAWAVNTHGTVTGVYLVVVVLAVLMDLGVIGGGGASARRRRRRD